MDENRPQKKTHDKKRLKFGVILNNCFQEIDIDNRKGGNYYKNYEVKKFLQKNNPMRTKKADKLFVFVLTFEIFVVIIHKCA